MPTYKQICESVLEEANGRPVEFASTSLGKASDGTYSLTDPTQRNIVRWVDDLYVQVQQQMMEARFMQKRGLFIRTADSVEEYSKSGIREVNRHSFYTTRQGQTARIPITVLDYDFWLQQERVYHLPDSNPLWLIRKPNFQWLVYPPPSAVWNIYGEWWLKPEGFDAPDDEPLWDEEYHDVLKWKALQLFAAEFSAEGAQQRLMARIGQMLPPLEKAFKRRYIPAVGSACPLV